MKRLQRLQHDESGMTYVFIGLGLMALLSASMLAIDVGMLMTARNQAQNSADAGALAGATALAFDNWDDRTPSGPAVQNAIRGGTSNLVQSAAPSVRSEDVDFPADPVSGEFNRVRVKVWRTGARGNPVSTLIASYFGMRNVDIGATATAEAAPANAMTCVKPFIIPDRWVENTNPPWDADDTFDMYDNQNNPLPNADVYIPAGQPGYAGYNQESDRGARLIIRAGSGNNIQPTFYYSLALGGMSGTGGADYDWNIANCNTTIMHIGDIVIQEPGNMVGPTIDGAEGLIARDPNAYWDDTQNKVITQQNPSPRVFPIPLYDPVYYTIGKMNGRYADFKVANWIGFFLESIQNNQLYGRIIPIGGIIDKNYPMNPGAFPKAIRLVE
jgi:Putative Flp pilus-assembly TadE/G-like